MIKLAEAHNNLSFRTNPLSETRADTSKLRMLFLNKKKLRIKQLEKEMGTIAREKEKRRILDSLSEKRAEEKIARIRELTKKAQDDSVILTSITKSITKQGESLKENTKGLEALNTSLKPPPPALNFSELIDNRFSAPVINQEISKDKQNKLRILRTIIKQDSTNVNDHVTVSNRLEIKQIADVWGFLKTSPSNQDYDYQIINNLIYKSYILDGSNGFVDAPRPMLYETRKARKAGCKITLAINGGTRLNIASFLGSKESKRTFIYSTWSLLKEKEAHGIILDFGELGKDQRSSFVEFISALSERYRSGDKKYEISITLPALDSNNGYDLNSLDAFADYFLIDFSHFQGKVKGDPIAPLNHQNPYNITSCVSRYLISKVNAYKFILCLPYHGIKWDYTNPVTTNSPIAYKTLRAEYMNQTSTFNEATATNLINIKDIAGNDLRKLIWFDDHNSLSKKYDLVLKMGLGGVALKYLEEGEGYAELTDELAYKFLEIDTVKKSIVIKPVKRTWWQETKHTLYLYRMGLEYPCNSSYDKVETALIDRFNILLGAICMAIAGFCVMKIKKHGTNWKYKKLTIIILLSLVGLLIATVFMGLFLDGNVPWFGVEPKSANDETCIPMPFRVLFLIITAGIILGIFIMRLLIFPLIKKEETP